MKQDKFIELINTLTRKELDYIFKKFGYDYESFFKSKYNVYKKEYSDKTSFYDRINMLSYWYLVYEQHKNPKIVELVIDDAIKKYRGYNNENK